jgi:hypothetical protein
MNKKLSAGLILILAGAALYAASAASAAFPQFWTNVTKTVKYRDVTTLPKGQPDAMQWSNEGPLLIAVRPTEEPILCNEVELGTVPLVNTGVLETKLAAPFGVAEGDECIQRTAAGGPVEVPVYFDTNSAGVVPATITVAGGPPNIATIHRLKLSVAKPGEFCTVNAEGVKGEIHNLPEGFAEEVPPNINIFFEGPTIITCPGFKGAGFISFHVYLDTMSPNTDTAFVE